MFNLVMGLAVLRVVANQILSAISESPLLFSAFFNELPLPLDMSKSERDTLVPPSLHHLCCSFPLSPPPPFYTCLPCSPSCATSTCSCRHLLLPRHAREGSTFLLAPCPVAKCLLKRFCGSLHQQNEHLASAGLG